jgi:FkbM family methyltransferase
MNARRLTIHLGERVINAALAPLGVEMRRRGRLSAASTLERLRALGVAPATVVDVGAAYGDWSATCRRIFPDARYILIEPLEEFAPFLDLRPELRGATRIAAAAGEEGGRVAINVHEDLLGTSQLRERAGEDIDGHPRSVQTVAVDDVVREQTAPAPYFLKVDVQGAEGAVLAGAADVLGRSELVILEVSFLPFFEGGVSFHELVIYMHDRGFAVYDMIDPLYRPLDGALAQTDIAFVPIDSPLRAEHAFASPGQRQSQNVHFRRAHEWRLKTLQSRGFLGRR